MPVVKLITECYTRRPDMIGQYSIVEKKYSQWLCQVNDTTLMSVWPMGPRYLRGGNWRYRHVGIETDFVAIARKKGNTLGLHTISHWWFFKYNGDMFYEVHWDGLDISQQLRVVEVFMEHKMKGIRLWDEGMEAMVALESL